eukprot:14914077-Ditylum_brightwellii.AAC.1
MLLLVAYFSLASAGNLEQNAQLKFMWMMLTVRILIKQNKTPAQIQRKIQHITQAWENLLYGTGGELSLKKTHWWLLAWIWEGSKACLATRGELPETMKITVGCSDTSSTVQRKEVNDSVKQLSVMANPAGNFSQELECRKDYSAQMATTIRNLCMKPKMCSAYIETSGFLPVNTLWLLRPLQKTSVYL